MNEICCALVGFCTRCGETSVVVPFVKRMDQGSYGIALSCADCETVFHDLGWQATYGIAVEETPDPGSDGELCAH